MHINIIRVFTLMCALILPFGIAHAADVTFDESFAAALVQLKAGNYQSAQKQFEELLTKSETQKQTIRSLSGIAETYSQRGLYDQARSKLKEVLLLPDLPEDDEVTAYLRIGATYNAEKDYESARDQFEKILALPSLPPNTIAVAHLSLFTVDFNSGRNEQAYKELDAIFTNPQIAGDVRATAAIQAGNLIALGRNFEKARAVYGEVDNINGVPTALQLQALLKVAESYVKEKKTAEASVVYTRVFTFGFDEGAKLFEGDKFEESIAVMKLCLDVPNLPTPLKTGPLYYIGASLMELKEGVKAITVLRMASIEPTEAELDKTDPSDTRSFRSFQTSARVRVIRLYAGSPNKENQAVAVTLINELLQDPNADLNDNRRAQLRQTLKSLPQPTP